MLNPELVETVACKLERYLPDFNQHLEAGDLESACQDCQRVRDLLSTLVVTEAEGFGASLFVREQLDMMRYRLRKAKQAQDNA